MKAIRKALALALSLIMVLGLAACGSGGEDTPVATTAPSAQAEGGILTDEEAIYMNAMSDFYDAYMAAFEAETVSERWALMAIAEAKFLESGVATPMYTAGGCYAMSRVPFRAGGYASWLGDRVYYDQMVITNEIITTEDYEYLVDMWYELTGTGTYTQSAVDYLTEQGYTFTDTATTTFDRVGTTWDFLSDGDFHDDASFIDYLYQYNSEGELVPHLATDYDVSDDGLTYTFYIREGVSWVDSQGRQVAELTADDWVAGLQHVADAGSSSIYNLSGILEGLDAYIYGETTDFSTVGIKAVDDYTLQYTLTAECPYFMSMIADTCFIPMSRSYYLSQGGVFGMQEYDEAIASSSYLYGTDQDHIAYCGPYLCTNVTDKNSINYIANESYWNADNVQIKAVNFIYDDGSDVTREYNDFMNGVGTTMVLDTAQLEIAKNDGNFDKYVHVAPNVTNIFLMWFNENRQVYANVADGACVSQKTEEQKEVSRAALQNQHFRLALAYSIDRASYTAQSLGEDLKYVCLRNSYVPGDFVALEEDVTVSINGTETTFPAGTYYGEIVQAQVDADGYPFQIWDAENHTSDGFDGWYNVENAVAELELAIADLQAMGYEVSEENPVVLDYPYSAYNETATNQAVVLKTCIEEALGGMVEVALVDCQDSTENLNAWFNTNSGAEYNYDLGGLGGIGADFGDPETYLDGLLPYGDGFAIRKMGLW
ncbi:MAG TPA: peptide ABC transporter substrate-binding protein [Candidatus Scatomorpha merdigallinarum]|nr:peptide ABC transporter substrate-binding protein [Candidatus Scatomorpha merdigallinarum]